MKKLTALLLALTMVVSPLCIGSKATKASAATVETYIGDLKVSKVNNIWNEPTINTMILLTPGQSINALYYTRLIAVYNSTLGCYVVTEKVATHCSSTSTVPSNGIGLAFNYAPISGNSYSNSFALENWPIWNKIRVGDKLKLSGIDVTNKTISTSGTWASSSFVSNAKISVTTVRDSSTPKTAYSDKVIVAMGDSVTSGGAWTEAISDRFNANVINSGFGGDTSTNFYNYRYQKHVAAYNPDIVFVEFGVNDALTYKGTAAGIETYKTTLRNIYKSNTALGATTVFITPNNIRVADYDGPSYSAYGGLQGYLDAFLGSMVSVAKELGCHCIDIYTLWKTNKYVEAGYIIDFGHPSTQGYAANIKYIGDYLETNMADIAGVTGVSAPSVTAPASVDYGSAVSVSWGAVADATSYKYEATLHMGEKDITDNSVVYSGTTTATSVMIPAQTKGKYLDIKITAVGADSSNSSVKTVMLGYPTAYPTDIKYLALAEINGSAMNSTSMVWTASKGSTFSSLYWAVAVCSPNKDGTYTVKEKHEHGQTKSVTVTGNDLLYAVHGSFANASYANEIKVGDTIEFCGLYLSMANTISPKAYVKLNGGELLYPTDLTLNDPTLKLGNGMLDGVKKNTSVDDLKAVFNEDKAYITVKDAKGNVVTSNVVGTGFTVNLTVNGTELKSYQVVIRGDVTGDGSISATDYIAVKSALSNTFKLEGAYEMAADTDGDGSVSSTDYITLRFAIATA